MSAVWALWLVGAQALLWTPLLRRFVNAESPAVHLEYSFAWSVWPGVVHARGLVIISQDRAVQWRLGIDRVSARAFYLKPLREVLVAPVRLRIDDGQVLRGEQSVAEAVEGSLGFRLASFDPRGVKLETIAKRLDLDAGLRAHLAALPLARGGADGRVTLHVAAGKVQRGSALDVKIAQARAAAAKAGSLDLHARVEDTLHALAEVSSVRLPGALLGRGRIELEGDPPDLSDLQPPSRAKVDLAGGRIDDARAFQRLFTSQPRFERGRGTFAAHLEGPARKLAGWARVRLSHVRMPGPSSGSSPASPTFPASSRASSRWMGFRSTEAPPWPRARSPSATWWRAATAPRSRRRCGRTRAASADPRSSPCTAFPWRSISTAA